MNLIIFDNGRAILPADLWTRRWQLAIGVDLLWSPESEELAFDIYQAPKVTKYGRPVRAKHILGASILLNRNCGLDIRNYLNLFPFWKYAAILEQRGFCIKHEMCREFRLPFRRYLTFLIIKLNPSNPSLGLLGNFQRLTTTRYKTADEISLSKCGLLSLPISILPTQKPLCDADYDPATKTVTLKFGTGPRRVRKDGTLKLAAFFRHHKVRIPSRVLLHYTKLENGITFRLDDVVNDTSGELRRVKQALGVTSV